MVALQQKQGKQTYSRSVLWSYNGQCEGVDCVVHDVSGRMHVGALIIFTWQELMCCAFQTDFMNSVAH